MVVKEDMDRIKDNRGPGDLERKIEDLTKQKEYLQRQCRKAGAAILNQEVQIGGLKKEIDRLDEENSNLRRMMSSKDGTE